MTQRLALLIAATPNQREGCTVYVPDGDWVIEQDEIKDSEILILINNPIFSNDFDNHMTLPKEGAHLTGPNIFYAQFTKAGTEKNITLMVEKCR